MQKKSCHELFAQKVFVLDSATAIMRVINEMIGKSERKDSNHFLAQNSTFEFNCSTKSLSIFYQVKSSLHFNQCYNNDVLFLND